MVLFFHWRPSHPRAAPGGPLAQCDRHASSLLACPLALCTMALDWQVDQEGMGETDQMQHEAILPEPDSERELIHAP
jgi:hypothetical protein